MGCGPSRRDQLVADAFREWQVSESGMEVSQLTAPNPELGPAEAVRVDAHTFPR